LGRRIFAGDDRVGSAPIPVADHLVRRFESAAVVHLFRIDDELHEAAAVMRRLRQVGAPDQHEVMPLLDRRQEIAVPLILVEV
jgi:hypothetical protein